VHRNWLAITHTLPIDKWYFEVDVTKAEVYKYGKKLTLLGQNTSKWTLDYPPVFAYFEWLLSQVARYVDSSIVQVRADGVENWQTVYFQRWTVVASDLVLAYALLR